MDKVRIWTVARTEEEIFNTKDICLTGSESGLKVLYDFNVGAGTTVYDLAGGDQNGTMIGMNPATDWVDGHSSCTFCDNELSVLPIITVESINDQAFSSSGISALCSIDTTIELTSSQIGVEYYLRDDSNDSIIDGPIVGTGNAIIFQPGLVSTTITYNVIGEVANDNQGGALDFDGLDDHIVLGNPGDLHFDGTTPFSMETWIYRSQYNGFEELLANYSVSTEQGYVLAVSNNRVRFFLENGAGNNIIVQTNGILNTNNWHHIAVTYDGAQDASGLKIYVDGLSVQVLIASNVFSGSIPVGTSYPEIGRGEHGYYTGLIGETRIWNVERSALQIGNNYSQCLSGTEIGLAAAYNFIEGPGYSLYDYSSQALHGTLTNMDASDWDIGSISCASSLCSSEMSSMVTITVSPIQYEVVSIADTGLCPGNSGTTVTVASSEIGMEYFLRDDTNDTIVDGPIQGTGGVLVFNTGVINSSMNYNVYAVITGNLALQFDGVDDYMSFYGGVFPDADSSKTIEFWLKSPADGQLLYYPQGYMFYHSNIDKIEWNETFMGWPQTVGFGLLGDGNWHHIAVTYDGTDARIYVDGVFETVHNYTVFGPSGTGTSYLGANGNLTQFIGAGTVIDEFRVWNGARSGTEIAASMNVVNLIDPNIRAYYGFDGVNGSIVSDLSGNGNSGTLMNTIPSALVPNTNLGGLGCSLEMQTIVSVSLNSNSTGTDIQSECESYTWIDGNTYNSSNNMATFMETNAAGCDSLVTLDLTITPLPNNNVSQIGELLESTQVGATYQWLDCDDNYSIIPAATNQNFSPTPIIGNYTVEVTLNGCADTSSCFLVDYTGIEENGGLSFSLYPNPTTDGVFTINFEGELQKIDIVDMLGRVISLPVDLENHIVDGSSLAPGKYMVRLFTNTNTILQQEVVVIK